ncbi:MAG: FAD-dependent oxidoreductase [Verrucomicrobiota bacterium]
MANSLKESNHCVDFCVVGGGLAGMCAAMAAARHGLKVALIHDRPVLGGNASSEIRMWVCGAGGRNNLETGIVEEIRLENRYRNPLGNWSVWDSILYEKVRFEPRIDLHLNCSVNGIEMRDNRIAAVRGWQSTTQTWQRIEAGLFADCSGDSILAPLSGAEFRWGREARHEFNEDIEPPEADRKTMGMSCLIQAREMAAPQSFIPPVWAYDYPTDDALPHRRHDARPQGTNFWWLEVGGEQDTIHDTERLRDELLKIAFGVWDHIKNHGDHGAENWALEWVGFLPGKRESRRYVGDHILTQNDVRADGRFEDLVAYGGWPMDDHHPAGFYHRGEPTIFHPAPAPFGIPYRCLYSRNIENLFCAGRNISATHAAMSSTRVMATCALLGQAVGTAAVLATGKATSPRGVYERHLQDLKQTLMTDDCWLPWNRREVPDLTRRARFVASEGDPEPLRNGTDRPWGGVDNGWSCAPGGCAEYRWGRAERMRRCRLVFDSDLNRSEPSMPCQYPLQPEPKTVPRMLVKTFRLEARGTDGAWRTVFRDDTHYQRFRNIELDLETDGLRLVPETTWGEARAHVFAFDVE